MSYIVGISLSSEEHASAPATRCRSHHSLAQHQHAAPPAVAGNRSSSLQNLPAVNKLHVSPGSDWTLVQNGCLVVNAPTANTVAAAEHGVALICALSRNVAQADASMKAGKWERNKYVGVSIVGKTLAVMGFGKVGHCCACL